MRKAPEKQNFFSKKYIKIFSPESQFFWEFFVFNSFSSCNLRSSFEAVLTLNRFLIEDTSFCLSVCILVCLFVCLHVCFLYFCLSFYLYVCLLVCMYVCLSVCMSVCLSFCHNIFLPFRDQNFTTIIQSLTSVPILLKLTES